MPRPSLACLERHRSARGGTWATPGFLRISERQEAATENAEIRPASGRRGGDFELSLSLNRDLRRAIRRGGRFRKALALTNGTPVGQTELCPPVLPRQQSGSCHCCHGGRSRLHAPRLAVGPCRPPAPGCTPLVVHPHLDFSRLPPVMAGNLLQASRWRPLTVSELDTVPPRTCPPNTHLLCKPGPVRACTPVGSSYPARTGLVAAGPQGGSLRARA